VSWVKNFKVILGYLSNTAVFITDELVLGGSKIMQSEVEFTQFGARHGALDYRLLDDIFASPSNGMIVLDEGFHILRVGCAVCRLLGYEQ
jgi:hypothetical protein